MVKELNEVEGLTASDVVASLVDKGGIQQ
ncbi:hypothetical protein A2U01_0072556, partial [Trifolium medium]|nr:hypothetical protein [Trifolium medium]